MTQAHAYRPARPNLAADEPQHLSRGKVGISCLIITESFFFVCFIVAYLFYIVILEVEDGGPSPRDLFRGDILVYFASVALFSSSVTVVLAAKALAKGAHDKFRSWLGLTVLLGGFFLAATIIEWTGLISGSADGLINGQGMWLDTCTLGTCFYSLVGFHALHVIIGLSALSLCLFISIIGRLPQQQAERFEVLSWYWHFVDVVWIFVFTTVYILRVYT